MGKELDHAPVRVALARLASDAARSVDGVIDVRSRHPLQRTRGEEGDIDGVVCTPRGQGYDLEMHLVVKPRPLPVLAEDVRLTITDAVASAELGEALGLIDLIVDDIGEEEG